MQDNINVMISNVLKVDKTGLSKNLKDIIIQMKSVLLNSKDIIEQANLIDINNNNGFILDFNIIENIFSNLENENIFYGDVTLSQKDDVKKIVYGREIMDIGNVVVIDKGNPYTIIEMAIRNIMAGNTTIFSNNGFMFGTNQLLVQIMQSVLEQFNLSKYFIQMYVSEKFDEVLNNFANIDLIVCIGDYNLQQMIVNQSHNKVLLSGYENFDLYIEDTTHLGFLNKIMNTGLNIQVYINKDTKVDCEGAIIVDDIDEAIAQINYNGSRFATAIFTDSNLNASKFIREVKSHIVTVNTSPTVERILDIKQSDLFNEKTIIYPFTFKLDNAQNIEL